MVGASSLHVIPCPVHLGWPGFAWGMSGFLGPAPAMWVGIADSVVCGWFVCVAVCCGCLLGGNQGIGDAHISDPGPS